ncbi:hypothetical protein [Aeromonas veronii]|uniref:hypothetical protein n=1 Tax=Aeromonas veronii TaxID=654 RepID=UPI001012FC55|nr:hypothetical protein [Aeromonas veronii]
MLIETNRPNTATLLTTSDNHLHSDTFNSALEEVCDIQSIDENCYDPYDDDDPLNELSIDDAVWAYQTMPHDGLPVWQPKPTRAWLAPLIQLASMGGPIINNWLQNKPICGPLPDALQSGLAVDNAWIRLYSAMNNAANRELLIGLLSSQLDALNVDDDRHSITLERGRILVQQLEDTFTDTLSESLAKEVIRYFTFLSDEVEQHSSDQTQHNENLTHFHRDLPANGVSQNQPDHAAHRDTWLNSAASGNNAQSPLISVVVVGGAAVAGTAPRLAETMATLEASSPLISRLSHLATAIRSASSGWRQRTAWGGVLFGTSAAALAMYHWLYGDHDTTQTEIPQNITPSTQEPLQPQQWETITHILDHIELPYLDFLFYEDLIQRNKSPDINNDVSKSHNNTISNQVRKKRNNPLASPDMIGQIALREGTQRLISDDMGAQLFERLQILVNSSPEMRQASVNSQYERDVVYLLKLIEITYFFIQEHRQNVNSDSSIHLRTVDFLVALQEIADNFSEPFGMTKLAEFKQAFGLNHHWLPTSNSISIEEVGDISTQRDHHAVTASAQMIDADQAIRLYGEQILSHIEHAYDPILNPSDYIDIYVDEVLTEFNHERNTSFSKDDHIIIEVRKKPTGVILTTRLLETLTFSMAEIAIGQHRLRIKSVLTDYNVDETLAFEQYMNNSEKELTRRLWERDLQESMSHALNIYRGQAGYDKRVNIYKYYSDNILSHCLAYLDSPNKMSFTSIKVEQFLSGNAIAKEVLFNGIPLSGVFLIPSSSVSGVLFSVDDPKFFHVYSTYARDEPGIRRELYEQTTNMVYNPSMPLLPSSPEFREWVINKLPLADAETLKNASFYGRLHRQWIDPIISDEGYRDIPISPFTFRYSENIDSIAKISLFNLLQRLESDIDSLVHSPREVADEARLENIKRFLFISSLALNFFMGATTANSLKLLMLVANMSLDIGYVFAALAQSSIVDDPEKKDAYAREAIISGVVSSVLNFSPTIQLGASGVKRGLHIYRGIKAAARSGVPELLAKRSWAMLSTHEKLNALQHIVKNSKDARTLTRLMGNAPDALPQSIHQALREESALQDMQMALLQVRTRLKSDVAHLKSAILSFRGPASLTPQSLHFRDPQTFLGPDCAISLAEQKLTIRAHGAPFGINNMSGKQLSRYLKRYLVSRNIDINTINMIDLRSCYSAYGGRFSTAQVLANRLQKNVRGYPGTITDVQANIPDMGYLFRSDGVSNTIVSSERGHIFFHHSSALVLRMRHAIRRIARLQRSISDLSSTDAIAPELNVHYRYYLSDAINLIEGRMNATDFGLRYNLNSTSIEALMSHIDARTGMSDEEFLLAFNILFYPGDSQQPGSTLFKKLMAYDDKIFGKIAMEYFMADDVATNRCGEIVRGQYMIIDYAVGTRLHSVKNWVGLYRTNDVPGIDDALIWNYLPFNEGQLRIDTLHLTPGKYIARFFYNNSYHELEFKVDFEVVSQDEDATRCHTPAVIR